MEDFNSKYTGKQVEDLLDQVANGEIGGGIETETDPIFSASPAATITEEKIAEWDEKANITGYLLVNVDLSDPWFDNDIFGQGDQGTYTCQTQSSWKDLQSAALSGKPIALLYNNEIPVPLFNVMAEDCVYGKIIHPETGMVYQVELSDERAVLSKIFKARENVITAREFKFVNGKGAITSINELPTYEDISDFVPVGELADVAFTADYNELNNKPTFKTINSESILGEGDIAIAGGSGEVGPQGPQGDKGDKGDTGVGVQSVVQTTTSNADGGSNVVTVTLTNGAKSTFTVKNGSKGSNGTNGTNGKDGADGATFTPSVDSAGNLSWTNNKGLTNPPTVNIKGPKGDKGDSGSGGGGSSSGSGKEYIVVEPDLSPVGSEAYISNIVPNKTYIVSEPVSLLNINEFNVSDALSDEYNVIFKADSGETILSITSYYSIYWANGVIPTMEGGAVYELSIQRVNIGTTEFFNAVLTPFKLIE